MDASLMARMEELEDENRYLKKMYAEERLKSEIIQEAMEKVEWEWKSPPPFGTLHGRALVLLA